MKKREFFKRGCLTVAIASAVFLVPPLKADIPGRVSLMAGSSSQPSPPFGKTYDLLSEEWWLWDFMQPVPDNPTQPPFGPCTNGQMGNVWFLYGGPPTVNCNIPAGKALSSRS